jgi:hypothetical protein
LCAASRSIKSFSKFLSRNWMNSYIIYKENLPTGYKSMSTSNYTIQNHDALCEDWWQEEKRTTGTSGTKKCRNTSENYLLKSTIVCVCVSPHLWSWSVNSVAIHSLLHFCSCHAQGQL